MMGSRFGRKARLQNSERKSLLQLWRAYAAPSEIAQSREEIHGSSFALAFPYIAAM